MTADLGLIVCEFKQRGQALLWCWKTGKTMKQRSSSSKTSMLHYDNILADSIALPSPSANLQAPSENDRKCEIWARLLLCVKQSQLQSQRHLPPFCGYAVAQPDNGSAQ
jgi:hypothetical protein